MGQTTESLRWANTAIGWIERALRQHKRLQKAYSKQYWEWNRVIEQNGGEPARPMPMSWVKTEEQFQDHLYFFVLTAHHAIKSVQVLAERGDPMPTFPNEVELREWRNISEHWDDPARGKEIRAHARWREVSDYEFPGLAHGSYGPTLTEVSGIDLKQLIKDLKEARKRAGDVSEREWLYCYLTADEAAGMLGLTVAEMEALDFKIGHMDFEEQGGVRYFREWVEARLEGQLIPESWLPYMS